MQCSRVDLRLTRHCVTSVSVGRSEQIYMRSKVFSDICDLSSHNRRCPPPSGPRRGRTPPLSLHGRSAQRHFIRGLRAPICVHLRLMRVAAQSMLCSKVASISCLPWLDRDRPSCTIHADVRYTQTRTTQPSHPSRHCTLPSTTVHTYYYPQGHCYLPTTQYVRQYGQ